MPRMLSTERKDTLTILPEAQDRFTLSQFYTNSSCAICNSESTHGKCHLSYRIEYVLTPTNVAVCSDCIVDGQTCIYTAFARESEAHCRYQDLLKLCRSCMGHSPDCESRHSKRASVENLIDPWVECESIECPILHARVSEYRRYDRITFTASVINEYF
jgi:hypothetical protein